MRKLSTFSVCLLFTASTSFAQTVSGVYAQIVNNFANTNNYGILSEINTNSTGGLNIAVYGRVPNKSQTANARVGVHGQATGGGSSYGVWGTSSSTVSGAFVYAVYAGGNLAYTGSLINASDKKLKEGEKAISNGLAVVTKLQPKEYNYKKEYAHMGLAKGPKAGFIAQEVQAVLPSVVSDNLHPETIDDNGKKTHDAVKYLGVDYVALIPYLVSAIQEQQQTIEALRAEISKVKTAGRLDAAENATGLLGKKAELFQNKPNPFSENTTIRYRLPADVAAANLYVYNMQGEQIGSYSLSKGTDSLTLKGGSLKAGMYIYSLVADGQELDSKRMILTK